MGTTCIQRRIRFRQILTGAPFSEDWPGGGRTALLQTADIGMLEHDYNLLIRDGGSLFRWSCWQNGSTIRTTEGNILENLFEMCSLSKAAKGPIFYWRLLQQIGNEPFPEMMQAVSFYYPKIYNQQCPEKNDPFAKIWIYVLNSCHQDDKLWKNWICGLKWSHLNATFI